MQKIMKVLWSRVVGTDQMTDKPKFQVEIKDLTLAGGAGGVGVFGDKYDVTLSNLTVTDTPVAVNLDGGSKVTARSLMHFPNAKRSSGSGKKYFSGFSFAKGDNFKD